MHKCCHWHLLLLLLLLPAAAAVYMSRAVYNPEEIDYLWHYYEIAMAPSMPSLMLLLMAIVGSSIISSSSSSRCIQPQQADRRRCKRQAAPQYNFYNLLPDRNYIQPVIRQQLQLQQHRRPTTYEIVLNDHNEAYEHNNNSNNTESNANSVRQSYIYQDASVTIATTTSTTATEASLQPIGYILVNRRRYSGGRLRSVLPRPIAFFRAERLVR